MNEKERNKEIKKERMNEKRKKERKKERKKKRKKKLYKEREKERKALGSNSGWIQSWQIIIGPAFDFFKEVYCPKFIGAGAPIKNTQRAGKGH